MSEAFCRRRSAVAWGKQPTGKCGMNLRNVSGGEEFLAVGHGEGGAAPLYPTAEMVRMEQEIIGRMQSGNQRTYSDPMLVSPPLRIAIEDRHTELSRAQLRAVDDIFVSREKIVGLDGIAGTGKTTTLAVIREGAEAEGYKAAGFGPTSPAVGYDTASQMKPYA